MLLLSVIGGRASGQRALLVPALLILRAAPTYFTRKVSQRQREKQWGLWVERHKGQEGRSFLRHC